MASLLDFVSFDVNNLIGTKIDRITLLRELGRGNKGIVFVGYQESLKRNVAVKILPKATLKNKRDEEMFETEAYIVAGLSHPNIIPIYEMGNADLFYYQIMPLIVGEDLDSIIQKKFKHPIPEKRGFTLDAIFKITIQTLSALQYAHEDGIVHRDIKPANILVEKRTNRPFVADFGIAQTAQKEADTFKGLVVGSPVYLAPEQASGQTVDGRSDIYATGMTFIKLLIGDIPRRKEAPEEIIKRKITAPETFIPSSLMKYSHHIDEELERIIYKAVAPNKEDRFQSAQNFIEALEHYRRLHISKFRI